MNLQLLLDGVEDFFDPNVTRPRAPVDQADLDYDDAEVVADALEESGYAALARDLRRYFDRAVPWRTRARRPMPPWTPGEKHRDWRRLA